MWEIIKIMISAIIMIATSLMFSLIITNDKEIEKNKKNIIILIFGVLIYGLIAKSMNGTLKTIYLFCIHLIIFKNLLKITYSESIFLDFLYSILIIIPDSLLLLFMIIIAKVPKEICYEVVSGNVISTIIVNTCLLLMTITLRKYIVKLSEIKISGSKRMIIYTLLTLIAILAIFYKTFDNIVIGENLLFSIGIMIIFVVILYSLIKQKMENEKILERYNKLLEFIKKYEIIIEEERKLRHENKNQLITIRAKAVILGEKGHDIIEYTDGILNEKVSYNEDKYAKFQYLPANGIKGLFYYKSLEAEEKGIKLSINIASRVESSILGKVEVEDFKHLGILVGVYLDNAIEASTKSKEKCLGIEIYMYNEDVIMIISNTYSGVIDKEMLGKEKYTTKGSGHGYGLLLVNGILNKSKRFESERIINDKLYIQKLIIKNKINAN